MIKIPVFIALSLCLTGCFRSDITKEYLITDASKSYTAIYKIIRNSSKLEIKVYGKIKGQCRILTGSAGNDGGYQLISDCNYILDDRYSSKYTDSVRFVFGKDGTTKGHTQFVIYYPEGVESGDTVRIQIREFGYNWL